MKPSDGTFLDLCGDALPGALVHARTHRSLQRWVYEMPLGGGGGWRRLQPHRTPPWQHDAVGWEPPHSQCTGWSCSSEGMLTKWIKNTYDARVRMLSGKIEENVTFFFRREIPNLIYKYMAADSRLNQPSDCSHVEKSSVKVPYHLLLSPLITLKHCSRCYSFNIIFPPPW